MTRHPSAGSLAARDLPARPNLEHLKNEAKQRLDALRFLQPKTKLAEAQHQLARDYGFANWRDLKAQVEHRFDGPALAPGSAQAQATSGSAIGDWIGELPPNNRIALHIRAAEDGRLAAAMDTPDFGFFDMVADDVAIEGDRLSFSLLAPLVEGFHQGLYQARWDAGTDRWIGAWTAHGLTTPLDFRRGAYPPAPRFDGLDGFWDGRLKTPAGLIRLIFRFKTDAHGTFAWLDSPDRNLLGRPAVSVARQGRQITVTMQTVIVTGELTEDGQWIEGRFLQGKTNLPLTLIHRPPGAAAPLPQREPAVHVAPEILETYVGDYRSDFGGVTTVSVEKGRLHLQFTGGEALGPDGARRTQLPSGPKLDLLAASPTKFFWRIMDATAQFELDPKWGPTAMVVRQNGRDTRMVRVT